MKAFEPSRADEESTVPRTLPTIALEDIRIASPCNASWDAMTGDDRVRFCGSCQKNVFNLSNMSRDDAEALIEKTEGRVCVRFYRRRDGTVLTQDCPVGLRAVRRRLALIGAGLAAGLGVIAAFLGLRRGDDRPVAPWRQQHVMGAMEERMGRVALPEPETVPDDVVPMMGAPMPHVPDEEVLMGEMVAPDCGDVAPVDTGR